MSMYADIVPILRLPKRQRVFTYAIPEGQPPLIGSLVRVPWRKQEIDGIVLATPSFSPIKNIQPIFSSHETTPSWTAAHVKTFIDCANRLYCSYADLASQFLPSIPKRVAASKTKAPVLPAETVPTSTGTLSASALSQLNGILKQEKDSSQLLRVNHAGERFAFYRLLAKRHKGQILILVPTHQDAAEITESLGTTTRDELFSPNPKAGKHEQWSGWQAVRDGTYRIIVATRSGVMLPCRNLSCIVIDQEERPEHAQWEAQPRYDARELAASLARNLGIPLWNIAYCPRVQTASSLPVHSILGELPPLRTIIHTRRSPLEETTEQTIFEQIENGKSVLFVTPHKARARTLRCTDCQQSFTCARCHHPLLETSTALRCPSCGTETEKPLACPRCQSLSIRSFGLGVQGLAETLAAYGRAPVVTLQSDRPYEQQLLHPSFVVSTPYACKRLLSIPHASIGCVVLFHPESILFSPTHTANELYFRLVHWHRMYAHDYEQAFTLVQSGLTLGHPLHTIVAQNDYPNFLASEISLRRSWLLPPFGTMIHLSISVTEHERESLTQDIGNRLKTLATKTLSVLGPRLIPAAEANLALHWLIRTTDETLPNLDKTLDSIYNRAIITVNPERSSF